MRTQAAFSLLKSAREIRVALVTAGVRIARMLTEKYPPPKVNGRPLIDYGNQVQHLVHELQTAEGGVIDAEDAHMKQEVRVSRLRTERNERARDGHDKLVAARQGLDGLQGAKGSFETAFVSGTAPRHPEKLVEQLAQSVTLLKDPAVEPRKLKVAGFGIDYSTVATDLESEMVGLRDTLGQLDEQSKLAEATMLARKEAIAELKSTVIWAGRTAEGLFHRAGEHELADRIRTSTRRPLRPSEQAADDEQAAAEQASVDSTETEPASEPVSGSTEAQSPDA